VTLYSLAGIQIGLEQRLQAIAPMLGNSLASSIAHNAIVVIDDTKQRDCEVLFSIYGYNDLEQRQPAGSIGDCPH
jgi:hypothetical protein